MNRCNTVTMCCLLAAAAFPLLTSCSQMDPQSVEYLTSNADVVAIIKVTGAKEVDLSPSAQATVVRTIKGNAKRGDKIRISRQPARGRTVHIGLSNGEYLAFLIESAENYVPVNGHATQHIWEGHIMPFWRDGLDNGEWHELVELDEVILMIAKEARRDRQQ